MHAFTLDRDLLVSCLRIIPEARIHSLTISTSEGEEVVDFLSLPIIPLIVSLLHFLFLIHPS